MRMNAGTGLIALILAARATALAQTPTQTPTPTPTELDVAIDAYVEPLRALDVFDGVVLVADGGRVVAARAYGFADREHAIANHPGTVFRIASISKPFTRALFGRLAEQGVVALDDPIARWLPDFPAAERITIRLLLDHRAGVPGRNSLPWDEEALAPPTLADLVDSIAALPLDFEPGTDASYSNGGYAVLAHVLELATGRAYGELLDAELLRPLGLTHTAHEADGDVILGRAEGYMPSPVEPDVMVHAPFQSMDTKAGGGSLVSTARDLVTFVRAIGVHPVLGADAWAELFPSRDRVAYQGRSPGFNVIVLHDRTRDLTVVVLANNYAAGNVGDVAEAVLALATDDVPSPLAVRAPTTIAREELALLAATYRLPEGIFPGDPQLTIEAVDGYLVARLGGAPVDVLMPQGGRSFLSRALWSIVEFDGHPGAAARSLEVRALYRESSFTAHRES